MHLFDLSLRHKLLLWGAFFVVFTVLAITTSNLLQTRENVKRNMLARSEVLGRVLAKSLYADLLNDDVWRAYETLMAPVRADSRQPSFQIKDLILLDASNRVFVSTRPGQFPLQAGLAGLGDDYRLLPARLAENSGRDVVLEGQDILLAIPLMGEGMLLGTLILVHPVDYYLPSFLRIVQRTAWTTLVLLLLLLPISWYWGKRMAAPLGLLSERMAELGDRLPTPLPPRLYPHGDELGRLLLVYDRLTRELAEKRSLERQMVQSDRLSALGRLAAGIAHEINNPLGGMLTAVDTIKRHGQADPVVAKVVPLLQRGLQQIGDIVSALLVEARPQLRDLTRQDIDDIHTLLAQQAKKQQVDWTWENHLASSVPLPATLVRQLLLNLLLNALHAAGQGGRVTTRVALEADHLTLEVGNDGRGIPAEVMEHLFEPFVSRNEDGSGLGLWVVYQIVRQFKGRIDAHSHDGWTRFAVNLPIADTP
jgi:signal transduction histidine kinase